MGAAWGLHLNVRRMYLSYFVLVDVLVFVLVDETLICYSCMCLDMPLMQHLFVHCREYFLALTIASREVINMIGDDSA